ncbi:hypothetical protein [Bradyrhizobium sp. WD16]|uniref:hypothetical protein n=1 Tax=Bradyrhizobium sp. WD16 TaxID=1521768 RepID=UPI0020A38B92|nr:hypothetical protein [Bradyrhizobium sp. WD16]UTD28151.1 hypothetical protein DB459_15855 [Bradyrhizobium sp. WD16]
MPRPAIALLSIILVGTAPPANAADLSPTAAARTLRVHVSHHHHRYVIGRHGIGWVQRTIGMNFLHNYGPGPLPGTIATYDGPLSLDCAMNAAAYRGQDRRRHPCR